MNSRLKIISESGLTLRVSMLFCGPRMPQRRLNDLLRFRAPRAIRADLQRIAARRCLTVSDIAREALRDYVARELAKAAANKEGVPA